MQNNSAVPKESLVHEKPALHHPKTVWSAGYKSTL